MCWCVCVCVCGCVTFSHVRCAKPSVSSSSVGDWGHIRATQAFVVLSLLVGATASICGFVGHAISWASPVPLVLAACASLFGLIAMACFAGAGRSFTILKTSGNYDLGAGFGLCVLSWILNGAAAGVYGWWHRKGPEPHGWAPAPPPKQRVPSGRL